MSDQMRIEIWIEEMIQGKLKEGFQLLWPVVGIGCFPPGKGQIIKGYG